MSIKPPIQSIQYLLPLPGVSTLADIDIDIDLGLLDVFALLNAGICIWRSDQRLVRNLLLELFVVTALTKFVDTGVVDL